MKRKILIIFTGLFLFSSIFQAFAQTKTSFQKPNVLFIITDQQSADAMSCVIGHTYINTPAMDGLAEKGTMFNKAYCAHPVCIPSRASMFSGLYPQQTGVMSFKDIGNNYDNFSSLGKIFQENGYETGYVGKWHFPIDLKAKSIHGFEFLENATDIANGVDINNSNVAIRFLKKERSKPFLLVVSYNNPHNICEWARGARGNNLADGNIGNPPAMEKCPPLISNHLPPKDETDIINVMRGAYHASRSFPVGDFGEKEWREYRWAYYRMIELVDSRIGKVLDELHESGLDKNTVIVFTSDHGDCQGAHNWNQKTVFYDEASRVPFIVSPPGKSSGKTSGQLVHTGIDIIPTICDFAGIPIPKELPGISLLPVVNGDKKSIPRDYIVTQTRLLQGAKVEGEYHTPSGLMVRSKRYKYCIYDEGDHRESLVDMEKDPGEMVNLARQGSYQKILNRHRKYLTEWSKEFGDDFPVIKSSE